jgi:hypothetical protein
MVAGAGSGAILVYNIGRSLELLTMTLKEILLQELETADDVK